MLSITPTYPSLIIISVIKISIYLVIILVFCCKPSYSQERTLIYKYKSVDGVPSFSDIQPLDTAYEQVRIGCFACKVDSLIDWHNATLYLSQYQRVIEKAAIRHKVSPAFIRAIIHAESHFKVRAVSKQGAQGLMQLMPATAQELGVKNPFIAKQNIDGGVKHLAHLLKVYNGSNRLAAAAYNAGEGAVKKYSGIPPFAETKVYVERVEILYQRYQRAIRI
jgi:soluble lytic murein transglycosylase-like protein